MTSTTTATASLDMRGKTITTYIAYAAGQRLGGLAEGDTLELVTDTGDAIDNDIRAWCRATGHQLASAAPAGAECRYVIIKGKPRPPSHRLAAVISDAGLEELLSPLGFALAAALEGVEVFLYFQGPAVRVLARGFTEKLHGWNRPFSRFARAGLTKAGHVPAQDKIRQLQALGARLYICGPSMQHFRMTQADIAFPNITVAEYLTFAEAMASADIHLFVQ
jgi:predicted peroxiredoxin/TusA-related sulfurtransferase